MRYPFSNILLAIFLYSCISSSDYLQKADIAIEKGNYREAIILLDKAISEKKFFASAYIDKAYCYTKLDKDDSAIVIYDQLIAFYPHNTLALFNAGLCKFRQENYDEAINYFNDAMNTKGYNPKDTSKSQFIMEYTQVGKELLGKENKFDVSFSELFYMAGLSHYSLGQLRKAYAYFMDCISRDFNKGECYYMIGLCWLDSNKKDKACESFTNSSSYGYSLAKEQLIKTCK